MLIEHSGEQYQHSKQCFRNEDFPASAYVLCPDYHVILFPRYTLYWQTWLDDSEYRNEKNVFTHLRNRRPSLISSLIYFHGCLEQADCYQKESFRIILEYANGGNLESLLQNEVPPQAPSDIAYFWVQLLEVLQALQALHYIRYDDPDSEKFLNGYDIHVHQ